MNKLAEADTYSAALKQTLIDAAHNLCPQGERGDWLSRLAYAAYSCKDAVLQISAETGASGGKLDNPIQRAVRDITIATNHVVFAKHARYGDFGRQLIEKVAPTP